MYETSTVETSTWSAIEPSGWLLGALTTLDPAGMDADTVLEAVAGLERVVAVAQATQLRLLARFAQLRPADARRAAAGCRYSEFAADEVAPLLRWSRGQATDRLALATDLTTRFPETLAAVRRGEVDVVKARALSGLTGSLTGEQATAVQAVVLPHAGEQTAGQFRAAVRRAVLEIDPRGREKREALARGDRRVVLTPVDDGMAELWALLPAPEAVAIRDRIERHARTLPGEDARSMDQRRADCLTDLLLGTAPREVTAQIHLTVPAATLNGTGTPGPGTAAAAGSAGSGGTGPGGTGPGGTEPGGTEPGCISGDDLGGDGAQPGHLHGYGPITPATARELAAGALGGDTTWRRILTDPADGTVLDIGRDSYRPPAALADHVRARDMFCRFPGCRLPAERCDLDHTLPYQQGGPTSAANLGALCRHHHRLKHKTSWELTQNQPGTFTWRSPTGHTYTTGPGPDPR